MLISLSVFCTINHFSSSTDYINDGFFIVKRANENYVIVSNYFSNYYMYEKNNPYDEGDILKVSGYVSEFKSTLIESQFNFKEYLKTYCVYNQINASSTELIVDNPFSSKKIASNYLYKYNEDARFVLSSINFGVKDYNSDIMGQYQDLNLINLLSNSGMFFSFVLDAFVLIFSLKLSEKKSKIISFSICFPYLLFNPYSFGLYKVFFVKFLSFLFKNSKKWKDLGYLESLSITSLIYFLIDPTVIFRLEFALSIVLSFLYVSLINDFQKGLKTLKNNFIVGLKIKIIIFIFFIPINLSMNGSVNVLNIFSQLIFLPIFKLGYFISFISFFIGYNPILDGYYFVLNKSISVLDNISVPIYAPEMSSWLTGIYYLSIFFFIIVLEKNIIPLKKSIVFIGVSALVLYFLPLKNTFSSEVNFINVGQGDSILIRDKFTSVLIDTGGLKYMDVAKNSLIPFLKSKRIYNIDTLFISHDDFDHSGAYESFMKNFHVKFSKTKNDFKTYEIGNLKFLNLNEWGGNDKNDSSLVLYLEIYNKKFLFTGDASRKIEEKIIEKYPDLRADYLKIGHHGSNTSTSERFIAALRPKEAIISCGIDNSYGHPHIETLKILEKYNVKVRRTDKEGTIVYNL